MRRDGCAPGAPGRSRTGPAGTRSAVRVRCRQARHRFLRAAGQAGPVAGGRPLRLAYADPPYPGKAWLYRGHPDYAGEVDHAALIRRLAGYDGWALSTSAEALPGCWRCARPGCGWRPGTAASGPPRAGGRCTPGNRSSTAGGRQIIRDRLQPRRADSIVCGVAPVTTLPGRVIGAKPAAVCRWIFDLLGAGPGDTLDDLFPGSGAVTRAWAACTGHDPSRPSPTDATAPGRPDPVAEAS